MTQARQICSYCRTELAADAVVCDACGMPATQLTAPALRPPPPPPDVPAGPEFTAPALRLAPEPPVLTAPALRPPPEPPRMPDGDPLAPPPDVVGGNPLASGAFETP